MKYTWRFADFHQINSIVIVRLCLCCLCALLEPGRVTLRLAADREKQAGENGNK